MKQTAVEFLVKGLPMVCWEDPYYSDLLEQAKEIEKQQQERMYSEEELKSAVKTKNIMDISTRQDVLKNILAEDPAVMDIIYDRILQSEILNY